MSNPASGLALHWHLLKNMLGGQPSHINRMLSRLLKLISPDAHVGMTAWRVGPCAANLRRST
ncbi:hypothetical protein B0G73_13093 [Paraburkholderia sp. BL25I1N1]|nr:hypothetical protein B0G73_13093 [Paraburkholderia sp. BL25I1N1]